MKVLRLHRPADVLRMFLLHFSFLNSEYKVMRKLISVREVSPVRRYWHTLMWHHSSNTVSRHQYRRRRGWGWGWCRRRSWWRCGVRARLSTSQMEGPDSNSNVWWRGRLVFQTWLSFKWLPVVGFDPVRAGTGSGWRVVFHLYTELHVLVHKNTRTGTPAGEIRSEKSSAFEDAGRMSDVIIFIRENSIYGNACIYVQ